MTKYVVNSILIKLLSAFGVKKLVLSSGSRNIPFVSAVETDSNFKCYSVIDERNAAFFALGISQELNEPVAIACTSGTAASNYLTGVTEAFYSHIPIVVLTFDRSPYLLDQIETQKIDQHTIFQSIVKKSVFLPLIKDDDDIWYCQRLINEALISMRQHQDGPVHINIPLIGDQNRLVNESINQELIQKLNVIDYISSDNDVKFRKYAEVLSQKKALVVMGQTTSLSEETKQSIKKFSSQYRIPILADNLSNFRCNEMVFAEAVIKGLTVKTITNFVPDIIISFGSNFIERIKDLFRAHNQNLSHWSIDPEGKVKDVFKCQKALFECKPQQFFEKMVMNSNGTSTSEGFLEKWKALEDSIILPNMPFTSFYVIQQFSALIPRGSILHTAILNSTRIMQFFKLDESIHCFANVNAFGIDGCVPTFMGHAAVTDNLAFLVVGDLSFFYGMNAISIKHRKNNIRILLLNNGGGAEFHIMPDSNSLPTIDLHIGAAHNRIAKHWVESMGYEYLEARDKESLAKMLPNFVSPAHVNPVVLEVFTDMKTDGEYVLSIYHEMEKCMKKVIESEF